MSRPEPQLPGFVLVLAALFAIAVVIWQVRETIACERQGGVALRGALNPVVCVRGR